MTRSCASSLLLLGSISPADVDVSLAVFARHANHPRIAADFAVLNVAATDVELDTNLDLFPAVRARHQLRIIRLHFTSLAQALCRGGAQALELKLALKLATVNSTVFVLRHE